MADVTVKKIEDFKDYGGQFFYAGKGLGVSAWGMNVAKLPAGWKDYPLHNHADDGQEEVYTVLKGDAKLEADGKSWELKPGVLVRVGPDQKRKITPGKRGVTILAIGGMPGKIWPKSKIRG
ncbi:hypothetical protein BVY01_01615 [bacterium I07]|nr:hypothetical protein BVY01_01615 [bacterium I07]